MTAEATVAHTAAYPPQPWHLRGRLDAAVLLVPVSALPGEIVAGLPPGWSLVRLGRRAVAGVVWVDYRPGGVLTYRELMATVLVRRGARVAPHVVRIWVDSEASRAGGRELWAIPKQLARCDFDGAGRAATMADGQRIAETEVGERFVVPGRWPARFSVVQHSAGAAVVSPLRASGRLGVVRMSLDVASAGPLGFLGGCRPLAGFTLADFRMRFGRADG